MVRSADTAAEQGDWDSAVVYYRDALGRDPGRVDLKIKLERATQMAGALHMRRARELEAEEQLPGAAAEYRRAAELDPTNALALAKAQELDRRIREAIEAARAPARIDTLREQAGQTSAIPRLDPRTPLPAMNFPNVAVRDLLRTISELTNINILYDRGLENVLSQPYSLVVTETPLEDVLNQVLQANQLTYKVNSPRSIFIYQDTPQKRQQFEDIYLQTFYLSHADGAEITNVLTQVFASLNLPVRPVFTPSKTANVLTVRATAPVIDIIERVIRANDKPQPEVIIEAEILEVSRNFLRQLGLDLNQWALGFTFSPELAPPLTGGTLPPGTPPPFNLNTISGGVSQADFYMTSPTALIQLLESNSDTKVLARPQISGRANQPVQLRLGDDIPIPSTTFNSVAGGGVANVPTTSFEYRSVGVNLLFTPRVTYQDEVVLDDLTLERSGLGAFLNVGGQSLPTIVTRSATTSLRLRDGESRVIAGLFRDDDRRTIESLPGLSRLPVLGQIFGNTDRSVDQTDIIMILTPRIVRPHEITAADLQPIHIGTATNVGLGSPQLLSPEALDGLPVAPAPAPPGAPVQVPGTPDLGVPVPGGAASNVPGVVPIEPVSDAPAAPGTAPDVARMAVVAPPAGPDGTLAAGSGPFTLPIQIADAVNVRTISITITYDPQVLASPQVGQGPFMRQAGIAADFTQKVDVEAGRIELAFSRPADEPGASGSGVVGAVAFTAGSPGTTDVMITGVATSATGEPVPLVFTPAHVIVK
jgi:general secretion pathway protein D